jgi:hypothetical protein
MKHDPAAAFEGRPEAIQPSSSGVSVLDSHRALVEIVGVETIERALGRVSAPIAAAYRELLAVSWIPIADVEVVYRAIAEEAGMPVEELQVATVRRGIEHTVRGAWKMLLRITTDEALIKRTPLIYSRAFNVGTLEAKVMEKGYALLALEGFPTISDFSLLGLSAGIEGVLRSAGRKETTVTFDRTANGARLEARWRT